MDITAKLGTLSRRAVGLSAVALLGLGLIFGGAEAAETWPDKPVTLLVPTNPGGSQDRLARALAPHLSEQLGQPVTVTNKGPSLLGHTYYLQQPDDGYTILVSTPYPFRVVDVQLGRASFVMDDFAFLNAQWVDDAVLMVHKDSPYHTVEDLIEDIKARPNQVKTGVVANSVGHLLTAYLLDQLGLSKDAVRIVTYGGGGPKRAAFAGHQIDFGIEAAAGSEPIKEYLRPLAIFAEERTPEFDVPTMNEAMEPYGITMPNVPYQFLSLAVSDKFRQKHPDRWERLVEANRKMLESDVLQEELKALTIGGDWRGPEATQKLLDENTKFIEGVAYLLDRTQD